MAQFISTAATEDLCQVIVEWAGRHAKAGDLLQVEELTEAAREIVSQCLFDVLLLAVTGKATYRGSKLRCPCGAHARFVSYRTRWVKSGCGESRIGRAYYHCASCKRGWCPWDKEQGLNDRMWSPRLKGTVCQVAGRLTYGEGVSLLSELGVVELEESSAEMIVEEVGVRVRAEEARRVECVQAQSLEALSVQLMCEKEDLPATELFPRRAVDGERLYVGVDAATAHIGGGWHNVQVGTVFTVRADSEGQDALHQRSYLAAQSDVETFGHKLRMRAEEWNIGGYAQKVVLADGAPCNWNQAQAHFPTATHILDFYHVSEHVWNLSRALYRQDDAKDKARGDRWVQERLDSLKKKGPAPLLRSLKRRKGRTAEQREAIRKERGYFCNNRSRMNYPEYLEAGMMIGSGPVEAACKVVVAQRMKQAGMRWSVGGADSMLAVRTTLLNQDRALLHQMARAA